MKWCQWFMTCKNRATGAITHPILGEVPVCDRCRALAGEHANAGSAARTRAAREASA